MGVDVRFSFDDDAFRRAVQSSPGWKKLEADINEKMRSAVADVAASHSGLARETVDAELRRWFADLGIHPTEPGFSRTVDAISQGETS